VEFNDEAGAVMGLDPEDHRDRFAGRDVYVFGSGPSLNHIDPSFFDDKIVVTANHGATLTVDRVDYLVTKYHRHAYEYLEKFPGTPIVVTRGNTGLEFGPHLPDDAPFIVVEHNNNTCQSWNLSQWPEHGLVATWSTITTAMHWAAHIGAANIIMVGHDLGHIDQAGRIPGYRQAADGVADDDGDRHMWRGFDEQSRLVKAELLRRYDSLKNVVSLLPFINANMEGHAWSSFAGNLNAAQT
jgi:hypothetical protein